MQKQLLKILILLTFPLLFEKCAQVVPLTGGNKDITPPKLMMAVPNNSSVNFSVAVISLKFDEFVKLKDLKNQVIITPGFKTEPEIEAEGKKIKITVNKDELKPNTTYRIFFGKSVTDMTEGNPLSDFEYVFSTGTFIDTLKLKGVVQDAFNEDEVNNAVVGLYLNAKTDSLAFKVKPDYYTKSNIKGEYQFSHLPPNSFKVIAFNDQNKNLLYDGESETIAFKDEVLILKSDSAVNLKTFKEEATKLFPKKNIHPYYGKVLIIYNKKSDFKTNVLEKPKHAYIYESNPNKEKDTIAIYYNNIFDTIKLSIKSTKQSKADTITLNLPKFKSNNSKTLSFTNNTQGGLLARNLPFRINFYNLIDTAKSNLKGLFLLYKKDSAIMREPAKFTYNTPYSIELNNKLDEEVQYKLVSDSACFYDFAGKYNDSLKIVFKLQNKSDLGKVAIKLLLNTKQSYIVQLINDKEQIAHQDFIKLSLSSSNATEIDFTDVAPGTYIAKIIFDDNENKKWDTGNYLMQKQAEKVFISSKQIKVMADWDVEEEIQIK